MKNKFDVLVIGDGVAGSAAAITLSRSGAKVAVIHRQRSHARPTVGEYLPPEGVLAAHALKLGDLLHSPAHQKSAGVLSLWGSTQAVSKSALESPGGQAFCLNRGVLQSDLEARRGQSGVQRLLANSAPEQGKNGWAVNTQDGAVAAPVLIDASGRAAVGARTAGARVRCTDELVALACMVSNAPSSDTRLAVESTCEGWVYGAPLTKGRQVAVVLTDGDCLPRGRRARQEFAAAQFTKSTLLFHRLGKVSPEHCFGYAACSQITEPSAGPTWVAIGDAAMAFDPLGSAGLTKALRDAKEVSDILSQGRLADLETLVPSRVARFRAYETLLFQSYCAEHRYTSSFWRRRRKGPDFNARL